MLVPLLMGKCGLERKQALATSVAVIAPLCLASSAIYLFRGGLELGQALPYLAGGLAGGLFSSRVMARVPSVWLRRAFALVLLYGGVRALL